MPFVFWYGFYRYLIILDLLYLFPVFFLTVRKMGFSNCLRNFFLSYIMVRKMKGGITIGYT